MSDKFRVSQSKVKTKRRCNRAYHNKYVLNLKRKRVKRPLMFGRIVHQMLEADACGNDPFQVLDDIGLKNMKLFAAEKEMYGEIIDDIALIMEEYFEHYENSELVYVKVNGKQAEHEFEIEVMPDVIWNGKIDAIAKEKRLRFLTEHKTFTKMPNDEERWRNLQSVTYFEAIDILGWGSVDGTIWDYIRSKSPPRPGLLRDGSMSKKAIDTLPSAIRATLRQHGLRLRDYDGFIVKARTNRPNWFKRIKTPVKTEVRKKVFADFLLTIQRMVNEHGKVSDMNIERHCGWCDFEPLCRAELEGSDVDYVKQKEYYVDDKAYQEIGDETADAE